MYGAEKRIYRKSDVVVFKKTTECWGGLSNMAAGYPIVVSGFAIRSAEALYQACRYPHLPAVQKKIILQSSPMTAKMVGKPYRHETREDWDLVRVRVMKWVLRVKLAQNWEKFSKLLLDTGIVPIVELSSKDDFWGAKEKGKDTLQGVNALGRLLMELRERIISMEKEALTSVNPLKIGNFRMIGKEIGIVYADDHSVEKILEEYQNSLDV